MRRLLSNGLVLFAGFFALPGSTHPEVQVTKSTETNDPRLARLKQFFHAHGAPITHLAQDFVLAADRNRLDYRLLPSICMVESGGGKRYMKNNMFGWNSARTAFPTLRDSVHRIAERLANSKLYRDKGLNSLLTTYNNENPHYPALVRRYMRRVDPTEPLGARRTVIQSSAFRSKGLPELQR